MPHSSGSRKRDSWLPRSANRRRSGAAGRAPISNRPRRALGKRATRTTHCCGFRAACRSWKATPYDRNDRTDTAEIGSVAPEAVELSLSWRIAGGGFVRTISARRKPRVVLAAGGRGSLDRARAFPAGHAVERGLQTTVA